MYIVKCIHVTWWQGSQEISRENHKSKCPIRTSISQINQKPECFKVKKTFEFRNFIPYSDRGNVAKTPSIIFRCNEQDIWTCWGQSLFEVEFEAKAPLVWQDILQARFPERNLLDPQIQNSNTNDQNLLADISIPNMGVY